MVNCSGKVASISPTAFHGKSNVTTIVITSHALKSLPADWFVDLVELTSVTMTNGLLRELPAGLFDNNTHLSTLDFSRNRISGVYCEFGHVRHLRGFDLTGNRLTALAEVVFAPLLQSGTTLTLTSNALMCDCTMAWILDVNASHIEVTSEDWCPRNAVIDRQVKCIFQNRYCARDAYDIHVIKSECSKKGNIQHSTYIYKYIYIYIYLLRCIYRPNSAKSRILLLLNHIYNYCLWENNLSLKIIVGLY